MIHMCGIMLLRVFLSAISMFVKILQNTGSVYVGGLSEGGLCLP